uniref:Uncharacterized protein n=1 Tax=Octopus bimaculoides TaxID=37653 RepID=A0A0L8FSF0_OCTBM
MEDRIERKRRLARERKARQRIREREARKLARCHSDFSNIQQVNQRQTEVKVISRREIARLRTAERRRRLSQEELNARRELERRRSAAKRQLETQEQKQARLEKERIRLSKKRQNETQQERKARLEKERIRMIVKRQKGTQEERKARVEKQRKRFITPRHQNESVEDEQRKLLGNIYGVLATEENEEHGTNERQSNATVQSNRVDNNSFHEESLLRHSCRSLISYSTKYSSSERPSDDRLSNSCHEGKQF